MSNKFYEVVFHGVETGTGVEAESKRVHLLLAATSERTAHHAVAMGWEGVLGFEVSTPEHYTADGDQPVTCPQCGARTELLDAEAAPSDWQGHTCLNEDCGYVFTVEFADE